MEFHDYVRSVGLDPLALSAEQLDAMEAVWRQQNKPKPAPKPADPNTGKPAGETIEDVVAAAEKEKERRDGITALAKTYIQRAPDRLTEIDAACRIARDNGLTVQEAEHALLKACYANGPAAFVPSQPQISQQVVEAAAARAAGVSRETVERSYSDQVLSAADRHFKGGCGLQRLLAFVAQSNGVRDAHVSDMKGLLRGAFAGADGVPVASGFGPSTYSVSGILSNLANKFILDAFNAVERTWRLITAVRPVSDFKQITSYALTGDLTYKKIGPGGEVKHGTFGEQSYTNQAHMYGLMLGLSFQDIRNDDLGALNKLGTRLGRGGALTINDVFWAAFLAGHGTFWSAANGNYAAHADYAFTLEKLGNAEAAWSLRTDPDGKPMTDEAMFLLTPPLHKLDGKRYMASSRVSDDASEGEVNPLAGMWTPISSRYIANSSITGYSTSNYFLVADPAVLPVIETVFLDGKEEPTVETAEPDFDRLGIMLRGTHAFGVSKQEPRGAYKFKQTAD